MLMRVRLASGRAGAFIPIDEAGGRIEELTVRFPEGGKTRITGMMAGIAREAGRPSARLDASPSRPSAFAPDPSDLSLDFAGRPIQRERFSRERVSSQPELPRGVGILKKAAHRRPQRRSQRIGPNEVLRIRRVTFVDLD